MLILTVPNPDQTCFIENITINYSLSSFTIFCLVATKSYITTNKKLDLSFTGDGKITAHEVANHVSQEGKQKNIGQITPLENILLIHPCLL